MKLYHYVAKPNNALKKGILSFAKNPESDLTYYIKRSGVKTHAGIVKWMEKCFKGRSRGIRVLIEPLQYTRRTLQGIKGLIDSSDLFEIIVSAYSYFLSYPFLGIFLNPDSTIFQELIALQLSLNS